MNAATEQSTVSAVSDYYVDYDYLDINKDSALDEIRILLFQITCISAGLPALIWAVRLLRQLQSRDGTASAFMVSLLLSDALELLLSPYFMTGFLWDKYPTIAAKTWTAIRLCGCYFHQLLALEGILTLRKPLCLMHLDTYLSSRLLSITISIIVWTFSTILVFNSAFMSLVFPCGCTCVVAVTTCVLACKASRSISYTGMNPALYVTAVAVFTQVFLYGPYMLLHISGNLCHELFRMSVCTMTLRLIADPLLCVLICRVVPLATITDRDRTP